MEEICRDKGAPAAAAHYFQESYDAQLRDLTQRFQESGWLAPLDQGVSSPALGEILDLLDHVDWKNSEKDRKAILKFFDDTLEKVLEKGGARGEEDSLDFDLLEDGVHEFRRTARWVCIYPLALGGLCRLVGRDRLDPSLAEYHTPDVVDSPFNHYPEDPREEERIDLEASLIFSFSFLIDRIGRVKDVGLGAEGLELALGQTQQVQNHEEARALAMDLMGPGTMSHEEITAYVRELLDGFLHRHQIPQQLQERLAVQQR